MALNKNFIKFVFGTVTETDQGIKLTEISELIELLSFMQLKETTDLLWGGGYNLYIHSLCNYLSHKSSIKPPQSSN